MQIILLARIVFGNLGQSISILDGAHEVVDVNLGSDSKFKALENRCDSRAYFALTIFRKN